MSSVTDLERLFRAGINAYQQGEYQRAIVALSRVSRGGDSAYRIKASMGLVKVYMGQQNWSEAKALCEKISTSSKPALQQWSKTTLEKIEAQVSAEPQRPMAYQNTAHQTVAVLNSPAASGFVPLTPSKKQLGSGFTPLSAEAEPATAQSASAQSADAQSADGQPETGFQPLKSKAQDKKAVNAATPSTAARRQISAAQATDSQTANSQTTNSQTTDGTVLKASALSTNHSPHPETDCVWQYANRLEKGRSLGKIKRSQLWAAQIFSALSFYALSHWLIHILPHSINRFLLFLDAVFTVWIRTLPSALLDLTWPLLMLAGLVALLSPWLWDAWLRLVVSRKPLPMAQLRSHSTEAASLITRRCKQERWPLPKLWLLPTKVPLIFSYGWLPRNARLVLSQGLIDTLEEDELAALTAYELAHWKSWHWLLLSAQGLILQVALQLYWALAIWGNARVMPLRVAVGALSTVSYIAFWLCRLPGLWVTRLRTYYSDRAAVVATGNPNGLTRGLAKLSFAMAKHIEQKGHTPVLLEGLALLAPVSPDLARHSLYGQVPLPQLFGWDSLNPLRGWMSCLEPHPPLGDRLRLIMAYAQHWKLTPEIQLLTPANRQKRLSAQAWGQLIRQGMPFFGMGIGCAVGLALWACGAIASAFGWQPLVWLYKDMPLLWGFVLLGFAVGTFLRINSLFPDLAFSMPVAETLAAPLSDDALLPISSLPIKLSGQILGRPGIANWLGQDLLLKSPAGLLKLRFFSGLGPLGNVLTLGKTPMSFRDRQVQVLGWFRRGAHPWLDIDRLRGANGQWLQGAHPIHSLVVAMTLSGYAFWQLMFAY
ncbi:MAG: M48 family metalloprotease [Cyanobacteria bacterium J06643_4]